MRQLFSQKASIIDFQQGFKYSSEQNKLLILLWFVFP